MLEELLEKVEEVVEDLNPELNYVEKKMKSYEKQQVLENLNMTEAEVKEMIETVDRCSQSFGVAQRRAVERMRKLFF